MKKQITLPDLGEGIDNAEVSEVSVSVGDSVEKNDTLIVLESDKASMEIPAEEAGVVLEVLINKHSFLHKTRFLRELQVL